MKTLRPQRGIAARTENKIRRRQNILDQARTMIATDGFQAFTLVELANKAQVTVPTIHNLIGNKTDICRQLVEDMVTRTEHILEQQEFSDPISTVEAFTNNLMALYADDETFYKAAFFIGEQEKLFERELPSGIFHNALQLAHQVCIDAREKGYLMGNIDSWLLAEKLFANQRLARQDWMNGYIDLSEYKHQVLTGMFLTLAADASVDFHQELIQKVTSLTQSAE